MAYAAPFRFLDHAAPSVISATMFAFICFSFFAFYERKKRKTKEVGLQLTAL
jgi:hypothetical protein